MPSTCTLFALSFSLAPLASADIQNSFDHYDEGWTSYGDTNGLDWSPLGSVIGIDKQKGGYWGFSASPQYLGDHSDYAGGAISWDLLVSALGKTDPAEPDVWLISSDLVIVIDIGDPDKAGGWVHRQTQLRADAGWRVGGLAGPAATDEQFFGVMRDLKELRIRGEYSDGPDYAYLDNVVMSRGRCYPDCDHNQTVDLFDFLCFTNEFNAGESAADCDDDGGLDLFDFLCFVTTFNEGC